MVNVFNLSGSSQPVLPLVVQNCNVHKVREIHKILERLLDSRKRRGTSVGSGAPLPGVCLFDPGWHHSPKARDKHVLATASSCRDLYTDEYACSNEFSGLASKERPFLCYDGKNVAEP